MANCVTVLTMTFIYNQHNHLAKMLDFVLEFGKRSNVKPSTFGHRQLQIFLFAP